MASTAVVLLNYNGQKHLEEFLPSVVQHSSNATLYLADNASTDHSVEWVKQNYPAVHVIQNDSNSGYAGGYNRALQHIKADYYVLLNTDIEVTPNWIEPVVNLMEETGAVACQPKVLAYRKKQLFEHAGAAGGFIDYLGFPFCRGRLFDEVEQDTSQYNTSGEVFWASGACLFIRADAFQESGGFDERFFAHMEEIDLCWRLKNQGGKVYYCAESTVYHLGGGTLAYQSPRKTFLNFRNNLLMMVKNNYNSGLFFIMFFRLFLDGIASWKFLFSGQLAHIWAVFKAHAYFYCWLPHYLGQRRVLKKKATQTNRKGTYRKSIVKAFFLDKKRKFSELEAGDFY